MEILLIHCNTTSRCSLFPDHPILSVFNYLEKGSKYFANSRIVHSSGSYICELVHLLQEFFKKKNIMKKICLDFTGFCTKINFSLNSIFQKPFDIPSDFLLHLKTISNWKPTYRMNFQFMCTLATYSTHLMTIPVTRDRVNGPSKHSLVRTHVRAQLPLDGRNNNIHH